MVTQLGVRGSPRARRCGDRAEVRLVVLTHDDERRGRRDRAEVDALRVDLLGRRAHLELERAPLHRAARARRRRAPRSARSGRRRRRGRPPRGGGPPPRRRRRSRPTSRGRARGASSRTSSRDQLGPPRRHLEADLRRRRRRRRARLARRPDPRLEIVGVRELAALRHRRVPEAAQLVGLGARQLEAVPHRRVARRPRGRGRITSCRRPRPRARAPRGTPPGAPRCGRPASCASCPPSASRAACACG